jgi:signal transduction histidine kinase
MRRKQPLRWLANCAIYHSVVRTLDYRLYHRVVSGAGALLLLWGLWAVYQNGRYGEFFLLFGLAFLATLTTSTVRLGNSSVTYSIDPIVSFAVMPIFGIGPAIVLKAGATFGLWLIKERNAVTWKKSWAQVTFNHGMHSLALLAAGGVLLALHGLFAEVPLGAVVLPWLPAAIVYDQVNLWLLIGIMYCQNPAALTPLAFWRDEWWASQLFVLSYAIGGGLLAFAIITYDQLGIVIFFLPVLLSAYAFHLYTKQMERYTENLEQAVTARTQDLTELNQRKDNFLAVLSHDMMTPLSNIRYGAGLIYSDPSHAAENSQIAKLILNSQESLFQMVRNLLDMEKIVAGVPFTAQKQPCDLDDLLTTLTATLQLLAGENGVSLCAQIADDLPLVMVDAQHVERIVTNLLSNALKYTETGGWVRLQAAIIDAQLVLTVEDSGYGIAPDALPTIFEHFKRAPQHQDKAVGSGLGLAIVKALVAAHDGTISVKSEVGKGSKFIVTLPLCTVPVDEQY